MIPRRMAGAVIMGLGVIALVIAAIGTFTGDDTAATTTPGLAGTTVTTTAPTTSSPPATSAPTSSTTTPSTTTTTSMPTTTTTQPPLGPDDAEAFIAEFATAIAAGDVDFLMDRLHTVALGLSDPEVCRAFVEREILALVDYRVAGPVTRQARTYTVGGESVVVDPLFEVPVLFTFQGQEFEGTAGLAEQDGAMRWFTECR